jgi:hypothetical protein
MWRSRGCNGAPATSPWRGFRSPIRETARQKTGPERRTVGKNGAGFGRTEVAHIAAGNALWLRVRVKEKFPALALVYHEHTDFVCAQDAADGAVDPHERELLHGVGSPGEFDFDREPGPAFFEPFQECTLDDATRH